MTYRYCTICNDNKKANEQLLCDECNNARQTNPELFDRMLAIIEIRIQAAMDSHCSYYEHEYSKYC
jgi:hypothetical protein